MSRLDKEPQGKKINWGAVVPAEGYLNSAGIYIAIKKLFTKKVPSRIIIPNLANKILKLWEEFDNQDYSENTEKQAWALRYAIAVKEKINELKRKHKNDTLEQSGPSIDTTRGATSEKVKGTVS